MQWFVRRRSWLQRGRAVATATKSLTRRGERDKLRSMPTGWRMRSLGALRVMWCLGLLSPLALHALPFLYEWNFTGGACPPSYDPCYEWSGEWPDSRMCGVAAVLAIASLAFPIAWHRRSLARLRARSSGAPVAHLGVLNRQPRALALVDRYAGRLAMVFAMLFPIYFLAWSESAIRTYCHQFSEGSGRTVPSPENYVPLAAVVTIFIALHFPTQRRVLGVSGGMLPRKVEGP